MTGTRSTARPCRRDSSTADLAVDSDAESSQSSAGAFVNYNIHRDFNLDETLEQHPLTVAGHARRSSSEGPGCILEETGGYFDADWIHLNFTYFEMD